MNRQEKIEFVESVKDILTASKSVIVVHYQGLTVAEITSLRKSMRDSGASFKVVKNRLVKHALQGTSYEEISSLFTGPTALAYADDEVSAAKGIVNFAKKNEVVQILGGMIDEKTIDVSGIKELAKMPSLDELRAKIVGILNAPATKLVGIFQAPAGQVARVISAYSSKS